jgi:hypothetical protein
MTEEITKLNYVMKITNILIVSASLGLLATSLQAQGLTGAAPGLSSSQGAVAKPSSRPKHQNSINARQNRQEKRIEQGVASGELTNKEAAKLNKRQDKLEQKEARMRSDGELSNKERAKLQKDLRKSNKAIKKQKHDKQDK